MDTNRVADPNSNDRAKRLSLPILHTEPPDQAFFEEYEKKEKCGIFGVWGTKDASQICFQGLFSQQHRGQESAGIAVTDGKKELRGHTGMGLVSQVFTPRNLKEDLAGTGAIGHVRYSTTGESRLCNAQPLMRQYMLGPVAVAHNGNLINAQLLRRIYEEHGHIFQSTTDTEIIVHLLAKPTHMDKPDPLPHVLLHLQGAFSLVFLFPDHIEACRDLWGIRPLSLGRLSNTYWSRILRGKSTPLRLNGISGCSSFTNVLKSFVMPRPMAGPGKSSHQVM